MSTEFKLPGLGENIESGDVVNVLVDEGDVIQPNQNVLELETDKAVIEVPCPHGGRVEKIHVKPGDSVPVGETVLTIDEEKSEESAPPEEKDEEEPEEKEEPAEEKKEEKEEKEKPEEKKPEKKEPAQEKKPEKEEKPKEKKEEPSTEPAPSRVQSEEKRPPAPAGPATRRFARQLGVNLHKVSGSGPGGRITQDDVQDYVKKAMRGGLGAGGTGAVETPPLPDFSQWGEVEQQPLSGIRRKTAENMSLAWRLVPHVTQYDVADVTELEAARKKYVEAHRDQPGKITMTALAIKASIAALRQFPQFNSSLDEGGGNIIIKKYFHIGVAVDTENGLLVPTLMDADRKSLVELAVEMEQIAEKARQRKLTPEQMQGGTFTISNLGGIGGTAFTPIVYHPQVAILGMSRARKEQVIIDDEPRIRLILPLSLSYDHRVIDGADGARFLRKVCQALSDPMQLLLEA
jgi:pyruvate dehydrogenase E2 component (dihydrolipoamide acetyltransferase)